MKIFPIGHRYRSIKSHPIPGKVGRGIKKVSFIEENDPIDQTQPNKRARNSIQHQIPTIPMTMKIQMRTPKKTNRRWMILGALLCSIATLQAQEPIAIGQNRETPIAPAVEAPQPIAELKSLSYRQLLEKTNPHDRERRMIKEALARRTQEQLVIARQPIVQRQDVEASIGQWQFKISNTPRNRSPYPDAQLDARTLSFPLPRNMTPGNRITGSRVSPSGQIKR